MGLYPPINNSASFNYGEVKIAAKYMVEEQILHLKFIQGKGLLKRDAAKLPDPIAVVDLFQIRLGVLQFRILNFIQSSVNSFFF